jgi:hypothetical protein
MSETQAEFFAFNSDKPMEAHHTSFWLNKKLPYSVTPAHMSGTCGVLLFTAMQEIQALCDQLPLADSSKTPEEVFDHVMSQHVTINTAVPSQVMLEFGRTNVRPAFAQSLSTLFQQDIALPGTGLRQWAKPGGLPNQACHIKLPSCAGNLGKLLVQGQTCIGVEGE